MVYSQTAQVTKMFVILPLGLMLKLANDLLNIANIYSSARCIKILVYFQLIFLISSPQSGLSF